MPLAFRTGRRRSAKPRGATPGFTAHTSRLYRNVFARHVIGFCRSLVKLSYFTTWLQLLPLKCAPASYFAHALIVRFRAGYCGGVLIAFRKPRVTFLLDHPMPASRRTITVRRRLFGNAGLLSTRLYRPDSLRR